MTPTELREEVRRRLSERALVRKPTTNPAPRYDAIYYEGVAMLDRLARGEHDTIEEALHAATHAASMQARVPGALRPTSVTCYRPLETPPLIDRRCNHEDTN